MMMRTKVGLPKNMIELFGRIRFCFMRFLNVDGMRFLLYAGAETLEALALDPADPRGERSPLNGTCSSQQLRSRVIPAGF